MHSKRQRQISEQIQRELAVTFLRHPENPFFTKVTIVGCDVSPDLAIAKVYISVFHDVEKDQAVKALTSSAGFLRKVLAHNLNLRVTPRLIFIYDESIRYGQRLDSLIAEAVAEDEKKHKVDSNEQN